LPCLKVVNFGFKYLYFSVGIGYGQTKNFIEQGAFCGQKFNKGPVKPLKVAGINIFVLKDASGIALGCAIYFYRNIVHKNVS
jgi:hypothetical protein